MHIAATLFREVLKSADPGVLAVVINYRRLTECSSLLCFTDTHVFFIANWKRVVTVVFVPAAAPFALSDSPEARLLSGRGIALNCRTIAEKDDAEQQERNKRPRSTPRFAVISRAWARDPIKKVHD
jgi:hypothetical protein